MTNQERDLQSQQREAIKLQKEASLQLFKQNAKFKALEAAQTLNPNRYVSSSLDRQNLTGGNFDIAKKSEEIYQWLIKDIK